MLELTQLTFESTGYLFMRRTVINQSSSFVRCVGVIAEVSEEALLKRFNQGWLKEIAADLDDLIARIRQRKNEGTVLCVPGVLFLLSLQVAFIFPLDLPTSLSHSWAETSYMFHMNCSLSCLL